MANFLKVNTTGGSFTLIPIAEIAGITAAAAGPDTEVTITLANGTNTYVVALDEQLPSIASTLEAFNNALIANPGGVVSTVVPPLVTAQVPAAQSGQQGRIEITQQAVYAQFSSVTFA